MALYKGQQKITPVKVVKKGGDYYVEQVNSDDGTCVLNITDADSVNKWKEYYTHMIQRDTDTIVVPDGIEEIGNNAFSYWREADAGTALKYITLPASLININKYGFSYCDKLELSELPANITGIYVDAFYYCVNLKLTELPNKITNLGSSAFAYSGIQITSIPESFTKFTSTAVFNSCKNLKEITFMGNMENLISQTFLNCTNLTKFSFPNNTAVPTLSNVDAIPKGANFTGQIAIPNTLYNSWTTASNWSSLTQAQWVRFINSWDETITVEGDYALFSDTSLTDVRHLVPTAQTYNVTLHNYVTGAGDNVLILTGNPTVEQNNEYVVTIEKTDHLESPSVNISSTFTPYITINGVELSSNNYTTITTVYRNNTYPTTITIKPNVINGDIDVSLIYSEQPVIDSPFEEFEEW